VLADEVSKRLTKNFESLSESRVRISTGSRLSSVSIDVGAFSAASRIAAAFSSAAATAQNVQNMLSLLQTQEAGLQDLAQLALRLNELTTRVVKDSTKSASDKDSFIPEFEAIGAEIERVALITFNGQTVFRDGQETIIDVALNQDETQKANATLFDLADGATGIVRFMLQSPTTIDVIDAMSTDTVPAFVDEVSSMLAKNGSEQSRLKSALEGLDTLVRDLDQAHDRAVGMDAAAEAVRLSKLSRRTDMAVSIFDQAGRSNSFLLRLLSPG
jgi:flagellin